MSNKNNAKTNSTLVCDKCGAENWNMASEGLPHGQIANEVKGYGDCDGVWRRPLPADPQTKAVVIPFPTKKL